MTPKNCRSLAAHRELFLILLVTLLPGVRWHLKGGQVLLKKIGLPGPIKISTERGHGVQRSQRGQHRMIRISDRQLLTNLELHRTRVLLAAYTPVQPEKA